MRSFFSFYIPVILIISSTLFLMSCDDDRNIVPQQTPDVMDSGSTCTIASVGKREVVLSGLRLPFHLASDGNELYFYEYFKYKVSKLNPLGPNPNTAIEVYDYASRVTDIIPLVRKDNFLYMGKGEQILKLDLTSPSATPVEVAKLPTAGPTVFKRSIDNMAFKGNTLYIAYGYEVVVSNMSNIESGFAKLDVTAAQPTVEEIITTPYLSASNIAIDGDHLYAVLRPNEFSGGQISRIDITQANPTLENLITNMNYPSAITIQNGRLFVAEKSGNTSVILHADITAPAPYTQVTTISGVTDNNITDIALIDNELYICEYAVGIISKINICSE